MSFRFVALLLALAVAFGVIAGPAPARAADAATGAGGLFVSQSGRLFDTASRAGGAPASSTAANRWYPVQVGGVAGIPTGDVSAVTVSFTVENPSAFGVVRADASGVTTPNTTTGYLSYSANLPTASNTAVLPVGEDGRIQVMTTSATSLRVDVQGYYTSGPTAAGGFVPLGADELVNTQTGAGGVPKAQVANGTNLTFQVGGTGGVPADASSVTLSIMQSYQGTGTGSIVVYPYGTTRPNTNLYWTEGKNYVWTTTTKMSSTGKVSVFLEDGGPADFQIAVQGYFTAPSTTGQMGFTPGTARVLNTVTPATPIPAGETRQVPVTGVDGIPAAGLSAVASNVTVVPGSSQGHVDVDAGGETPATTSVQFYPNTTTSAFNVLELSDSGTIGVRNFSSGPVNVVIDVQGWYAKKLEDIPVGPSTVGLTGSRPSATTLPFPISDQVEASVDVATGNLLVSTAGLSLTGVNSTVPIGATYNSLGWEAGKAGRSAANNWSLGLAAAGSLSQVGSNIVYTGADGVTWRFLPITSAPGTYSSPAGFKQDLVKTATTWTLTDRASRQVITFAADGNPVSVEDRNGNTTTIGYEAGEPVSVTTNAGPVMARTAKLAYDTAASALTVTQSATASTSRSIRYVKDSSQNLTSYTDAEGKTTTFAYSGRDLTSITSNTGAVTTFTYSGATHKVTRIDQRNTTAGSPGTAVTRVAYSSTTETLVAGPNTDLNVAVASGPRTIYTVNASTKLVEKALDPQTRERSKTYTAGADTLTSTIGAEGVEGRGTSKGTYGANNNESLTRAESPGGAASQTTYGSTAATAYLPASSTDDAGNQSLMTYNGAGNQMSSSDASGAKAELDYNDNGTVKTATAPGNGANRTQYAYNDDKQLIKITPVTGTSLGVKDFTYDGYGRIKTETDGRGNTTTYTYDKNDRRLVTAITGGITVTDTYDASGRLTKSVSPSGTMTNTYDQQGRQLTTSNTAGGGTISYTYDKASNQISSTDVGGTYANSYDSSNVLLTSTYPKGTGTGRVVYETDKNNRRINTWLNSNNEHTTWSARQNTTYDTTGRVAGLKAWTGTGNSSNQVVYDVTYCYNAGTAAPTCGTAPANDRSKLQWSKDNRTGQVTTYTYDGQGRLTQVAQTGGTAANNTYKYTYDMRGNRLTAVVTGANPASQTLTYNAANQITTTGYTYDGAGNLTKNPTTAFTYNPAQQMTKAIRGGVTTDYTYAGADQKAVLSESVSAGTDYRTVYGKADGNGNPQIVTYTGGNNSSHVFSDPVTGQASLLTTSTDVVSMYLWDGLGNPVGLLTDGASNPVPATYDPYGLRALTAANSDTGVAQNPYAFKAGIYDRGTGLVKFGLRWYDVVTGAWTQQDTLDAPLDPGNANRYVFAAGDPVNNSDSTGRALDWEEIGYQTVSAAAGGIAGAAVGIALAPLCVGVVTCIGTGLAVAATEQAVGNLTADAVYGRGAFS